MPKVMIQLQAYADDAIFFREKQNEYRAQEKYAAELFKEMVEAYKKINENKLLP